MDQHVAVCKVPAAEGKTTLNGADAQQAHDLIDASTLATMFVDAAMREDLSMTRRCDRCVRDKRSGDGQGVSAVLVSHATLAS